MKLITIERKLYKITERDWLIFEKKLIDARGDGDEFEEALLFIEDKYKPYDYISGSYNY